LTGLAPFRNARRVILNTVACSTLRSYPIGGQLSDDPIFV
jgi:hypothetical protein